MRQQKSYMYCMLVCKCLHNTKVFGKEEEIKRTMVEKFPKTMMMEQKL